MSTATHSPITAAVVPDAQRFEFLPAMFGKSLMLYGEVLVFKWMERLSPYHAGGLSHYNGGDWNFHTLSNGGYYMAPTTPARMRVVVHGNGFDGFMSADAAGIVATLFALCQLASTECEAGQRFAELYHALRDYVGDHAEAAFIFRAID
ncbi:antirestriction protein [Burkholderia cenocepacia]|uniref:antirestriction protein n=1 Tax=Burkholderia cenocepacia TaxID=95486 RepID=UPI002ABE42D1|nr:antirestriction protein [Burkholderia cenocepacia]